MSGSQGPQGYYALWEAGIPETLLGELQFREIYEVYIDRTIPRSQGVTFFNLSLFVGNSKQYVINVKDRNLVPVDLTGATAIMTWKETKSGTAVLTKNTSNSSDGTISMPTVGEVRFYILPADTTSLTPRQYVFDVTINTAGGGVYTVMEGVILLKQPVI